MPEIAKRPDGAYDLPVGIGHVGAAILDIVSGAMYGEALDVLREYIQNAVDGHARTVKVSVQQDEIIVRDDGDGMEIAQLDDARKVAISAKRGDKVGFRGIGIYSSFSVCQAVEVTTRPKSKSGVYSLRFEHGHVRAEIERAQRGEGDALPLLEAIDKYTSIRESTPPEDDDGESFTEIRLLRPTDRFRQRLDEADRVKRYLRRAVPLDFQDDFKHAAEIRKGLGAFMAPPNLIRVHLKTSAGKETEILQAKMGDLLRPIIRPVIDPDTHKTVAVIWLCMNRDRGVIGVQDSQGFLVRFKGFGVGDRQLVARLWPRTGSGVTYGNFTGEIYVLDTSLTPTADRTNFEDTAARDHLYKLLEKEFRGTRRGASDGLHSIVYGRRKALTSIDVGTKDKEAARVEEGFKSLEVIRRKLKLNPPLTLEDLLDAPGLRVFEERARTAGTQTHNPSDPKGDSGRSSDGSANRADGNGGGTNGRRSAGGGGGGGATGARSSSGGSGSAGGTTSRSGGGSSEDAEEDPPTITESLLGLEVTWPAEANEIFVSVERALVDSIPAPHYVSAKATVKDRLERWAQADDDRE